MRTRAGGIVKNHAGILILCCLFPFSVLAQNCSKDNPCATGCCSVSGYCGTTQEHCGAGNCVDTCDYKLECDADNPCASGCCSKAGYCGLGPDYCGKDVCVSGCDSKAECDPGFGSEWAKSSKCPLNVCCSKYGFCGTTDEFCGNKKVKKPTCSLSNSTLDRVVGYYEGWSSRRACNGFWPEQIPTGVYTHINFAFAAIDPETFEVRPSETDDIELMQRVTNLKRADPDLKVMIALGGWTFNDPGATRTTFSDIAGSQDNQDKFFSSLTKFLSLYDLDGVDLDWEYPVADDRGGKEEDFKNFPDFLRRLKSALQGTGGRSELSITLPASYWYLQNFDIVNLVRHVDFFNIMSYDLHGTWDRGNKWTGEYLNAHTNLTEIDLALDLLWRNNIDSSKVVMGLAFYGRTYTVVDSGCVTPGCMYASGGNKGDCSAEVGILLNSEIDQISDKYDLKPNLYNDSAVETLTWSNQWLSYDDATTLESKVDYARGACLGGVMVWAISHDTSDAKYSNALGQVSHRTHKTLPTMFFPSDYPVDDDPYISTQEDHLQCKWANCGDPCPTGWKMMTRDDPDKHHDNERYLENIWVWTADHDLDVTSQDQLDVYTARGVLIESQGPTWLYGTASEHSVLYQYQLYEAEDIVLGMIQTESPYYQPVSPAPKPFGVGLFAADPAFDNCTDSSTTCAMSWAVRVIDSSSVYLLGAGLYSWFSDYSQDCVEADHCQDRGFYIEESYDIWIYNLVTKAIQEMVSPSSETPTYAKDNKNGFLSSLLAWIRGPATVIGSRNFPGFYVWESDMDAEILEGLPDSCQSSLTQVVKCHPYVMRFWSQAYRSSLHNDTLTASICDPGCGDSLKSWFNSVSSNCAGYNVSSSAPTKYGGQLWTGYNETCLQDPETGDYCNDIIDNFPDLDDGTDALPADELCSFCFVERLEMMQRSSYSVFDEYSQADLETVYQKCGLTGSTAMPPSLDAAPEVDPEPYCASGNLYTTSVGEKCDAIALQYNVSSAALFMANPTQSLICDGLDANMALCIPFPCDSTYVLQGNETCTSIEVAHNYRLGDVRRYNAWVSFDCRNLQPSTELYGHVICLGPQGGTYTATAPIPGVTLSPGESTGYVETVAALPVNATVANGTTQRCGKWHVAIEGDSCASICVQESITSDLFLQVNPSLPSVTNCTGALVIGDAYCVGPNPGWETPLPSPTVLPDESSSSKLASTPVSPSST